MQLLQIIEHREYVVIENTHKTFLFSISLYLMNNSGILSHDHMKLCLEVIKIDNILVAYIFCKSK